MKKNTIFYNAHHSPIGSFASFTLGYKGRNGGFGLELDKPADQDIYIGLESTDHSSYETLPFYEGIEDESARYDMDGDAIRKDIRLKNFEDSAIEREFQLGTDTWKAGDLTFSIYSPVRALPDPEGGNETDFIQSIIPAIYIDITVDNTKHAKKRQAFFGFSAGDSIAEFRNFNEVSQGRYTGVGQGRQMALLTKADNVLAANDFTIEKLLTETRKENYTFGLGNVSAMIMDIMPGEKKTFKFVACFYRDGYVTTALDTKYYYRKYFSNIEAVGEYALENYDLLRQECQNANKLIQGEHLSDDQKFMMIHSIRSYYGSTEFLELEGQPFWIVNEGEYRMMNTFDLMVDQLFFEIKMNPWTVKNELNMFVKRYSYVDKVNFPGDSELYEGGISFTHDMGVGNSLSRPGYSAYERFGLTSCFSHMTHEQLVNWVCCASVYVEQTNDVQWLKKQSQVFIDCLKSMINRDHPQAKNRNGIMSLDSSRVMGGSEITTYDSLDESLGQARGNVYLATKSWAAYVALEKILIELQELKYAEQAKNQAILCANTIAKNMTEEGYIPAIFEEGNRSRIIPAIEGLVFPLYTGTPKALDPEGQYGPMIQALQKHLHTVLVEGTCLFADGGWKLSSTSDNSWLSKIYLCQFVARKVLKLEWNELARRADKAHVRWLLHPKESYHCWSDQMMSGLAVGSKYYPRGVTSILWLDE